MKKLFLVAITILVAFAFSACTSTEKTTEELLTQKKGWVLTSATSVPAFVPFEGAPNVDLFKSFFYECELDDINIYKVGGDMMLNYGKDICTGQTGKEEFLGKWKFIEGKEDVIQTYLTAYYDDKGNYDPLEAKIASISETNLTLVIPIFEYRKVDPTYTFTLSYKVAK